MNNLGILATMVLTMAGSGQTHDPDRPDALDALVQIALEQNPGLIAARQRVVAAEARVSPAGALPDPVFSLSLNNFPVSDPGFGDLMTMKVAALSQRIPFPGKRTLAVKAARRNVEAANAANEDLRLAVVRDVRQKYYEVAFLDRALEVVARHADVLAGLVLTADARYGLGTAGQEDVLKAQAETAALAGEASRLTESRQGVLAELNQLLDRPPATPVNNGVIPERVVSAAVRSPSQVSFVSLDPGARVADSPLRPLEDLLDEVVLNNPTIAVHLAEIETQRAILALARKAHLPDIDVGLSYGQRNGRTDMVSLVVAVPLPLHRRANQDARSTQAEAELFTREAEHRDHVNALKARVSEIYADLERDRTGLALLTAGMLPQGTAALAAATAGFQVARIDFITVLANQTTLFRYETNFHRTLTDFAQNLAELDRLVGEEALR